MCLKHKYKKGGHIVAIYLDAARKNARLTQVVAAKRLNISKGTLASYEAYKTIPSIEKAMEIASLYGMSVDDIIWSVG